MARVRSFKAGSQLVRPHPTEVDCHYQVLTTPSGQKLVHLSTFGSDARASDAKSSQSLQFDEETAVALMAVLRVAFPAAAAQ